MQDPDGALRFRASISFNYIMTHSDAPIVLIQVQTDFENCIAKCQNLMKKIRLSKQTRGDPLLKWKLADEIYHFLNKVEKKGYYLAFTLESFSEALQLSKRQVGYLLTFRKMFNTRKDVNPKISWDRYMLIMDTTNQELRYEIIQQISKGKLQTRNEVRLFKKNMLKKR